MGSRLVRFCVRSPSDAGVTLVHIEAVENRTGPERSSRGLGWTLGLLGTGVVVGRSRVHTNRISRQTRLDICGCVCSGLSGSFDGWRVLSVGSYHTGMRLGIERLVVVWIVSSQRSLAVVVVRVSMMIRRRIRGRLVPIGFWSVLLSTCTLARSQVFIVSGVRGRQRTRIMWRLSFSVFLLSRA